MSKLFEVIEWMDKKRWESTVNYNIIDNDIFKQLSDDQKIMVHWISYICDRQMPFEKIWIEGGYVFSGMVYEFCMKNHNYGDLRDFIELTFEDRKPKMRFIYKDKSFASRFVSIDVKSILMTFRILNEDRNIVSNINNLFNKYYYLMDKYKKNGANAVNLVAFFFHLLSYYFIERTTYDTIDDYFSEAEVSYDSYKGVIDNPSRIEGKYAYFLKERFANKKRVWCCVRDYLKSKEFNGYFVNALRDIENSDKLLEVFQDKEQYFHLELPSDVWNLKAEFIDNLIKTNVQINDSIIARGLRKGLKYPYYPEQLDLSFDFVPRMCSSAANQINKTMCKICMFGESGMLTYCHQNKDLDCPVLMVSCGYTVKCQPENCHVRLKTGIGLCKGI